MSRPRSGGRYEVRDGEPVLVERSGHKHAPVSPAPRAAKPSKKDTDDEDAQETAAGRA